MHGTERFTATVHEWLLSIFTAGTTHFVEMVLIGLAYLGFFAIAGLALVYLERRIAAFFQVRLGPNRVGPQGMFQTLADALKLVAKEPIGTKKADSFLYSLAPYFLIISSLMAISVVPMGAGFSGFDIDVGVFFLIAVSSIGVLGILIAGWGSYNKYALIGALRSGAQMISYELSVGLSLLTMILLVGSLRFSDIVQSQSDYWLIFKGHIPALIAFIIFIISGTAESNRTPFDLVEAESELGAGFHSEYSGIQFAFFFLSEFINMFIISAVAATVFWGGWMPLHLGGFSGFNQTMDYIPGPIWFLGKTGVIIFLMMWFRWTFPRLRIDQLMKLEWKYLLPLNLINILIMAFVVWMGWHL